MKDESLLEYFKSRFVEIADPLEDNKTFIIDKTKVQRITLFFNNYFDTWMVYISLPNETVSLTYESEAVARKVVSYLTEAKE